MNKVKLKAYLTEYSVRNKDGINYPVYSVTNSNGFCTEYFTKDVSSEDKTNYKIVPFGYFAYNPSRINVGSIDCQEAEEAVIVSPLYNVFKCSKSLDAHYLKYFFKSRYGANLINSNTSGSVRANLKFKTLCEFEIPALSLLEQERAVGLFERINNLITVEKRSLFLLNELIKSRFNELFMHENFPKIRLDQVSLSKGEYGAGSASIEYDCTRPRYVRITDINEDGTLNDDCVCSKVLSDDKEYKLSYGDFLFARMGATVGKTYAFLSGNQIYAGYLIKYKLDLDKINPHFLFWYTRQSEYWDWVKLKQSGAAQPGINAKKYDSLEIPLIPIEKQNEFALFVEQIDKLKLNVQKRIDYYQELLNKKMDEYFN